MTMRELGEPLIIASIACAPTPVAMRDDVCVSDAQRYRVRL
jgi:hypothetical protein